MEQLGLFAIEPEIIRSALPRPSWDETWLEVASVVAKRSRCVNSAVGAVIVDAGGRIDSTGYNGPPRGFEAAESGGDCRQWCPRAKNRVGSGTSDYSACESVHAEANALLHSDSTVVKGGTIYITRAPCRDCAKLIANSGLSTVIASRDRTDDLVRAAATFEYLRTCGLRAGYHA